MKQDTLDLLKRLTDANGVPGFEDEVAEIISKELAGVTNIKYDRLGSIICEKKGTSASPRIMLPGHMDEIGLMVKSITENGYLRFTTLGGWHLPNLPTQRVIVRTNKGDIPGVVGSKPPHLMSEDERKKTLEKKDLFIDIGATNIKEVEKLGVRLGDPVIPESPFRAMANPDYLMAKAWDDRVGCAMFISVIRELVNKKHPNTVYGVGTVQEEVGIRGAHTSVDVVNPDVAIICEVGIAQDMPGSDDKNRGVLGKGPQINLYDRGMIPHLKFRDFVLDVAKKEKIPYQLELLEGGATDGAAIHLHAQGVPTIYLGVPARYIHSHTGIIHKADYDSSVRLITALVMRMDEKTVKGLMK